MFNNSVISTVFHDKCMYTHSTIRTNKGDFTIGYFITHGVIPYMDCCWVGDDNVFRTCVLVSNNWKTSMGIALDIGRYSNTILLGIADKLNTDSLTHVIYAIANYNLFGAGDRCNIVWYDHKEKKTYISLYKELGAINPNEIIKTVEKGIGPHAVFTKADVSRFYKNIKR